MKLSKFLFYRDLPDENILVYQIAANKAEKLSKEEFLKLRSFEKGKDDILDAWLKLRLGMKNILIEDEKDELSDLRFCMYRERFQHRELFITLFPTMRCNFRCVYCFEKHQISLEHMKNEVEQKLTEMIIRRLEGFQVLNINWFGGEPLLEKDLIERISLKLANACKKKGIMYRASLVTNGYLLNKETILSLNQCSVDLLQLTVDGTASQHDSKRILADGRGTFDVIWNNLTQNAQLFQGKIILRVNTDRENKDAPLRVFDEVEKAGLLGKVIPIAGKIVDEYDASSGENCYNHSNCLDHNEFAEISYEITNLLKVKGVKIPGMEEWKPGMPCYAQHDATFAVTPNGDVYRCYGDVGYKKLCIGNIEQMQELKTEIADLHLIFDPTLDKECSICSYLPWCMGGCMSRFERIGEKDCRGKKIAIDLKLDTYRDILCRGGKCND